MLAAATLAALQSTRAIPERGEFYVADPISSIPDLWQQEAVRALQQGKISSFANPAFAAASAE